MTDILVMDYEQDLLEVMKSVLEEKGWTAEVLCTRNMPLSCQLAMIERFEPKVIVYDLGVPATENVNKFQKLVAAAPYGNVPFIMTTTNPWFFQGYEPACRTRIVLSRPFDVDDLIRAINFFLEAPCGHKR